MKGWRLEMTKDELKKNQRRTKDGPWCWANKKTLWMIRRELKRRGVKKTTTIQLVYHALTEIASNKQTDKFTCRQSEIAKLADCSKSTVSKAIKNLKDIGAIESAKCPISATEYGLSHKDDFPNEYTLLRLNPVYSYLGGDSSESEKNRYSVYRDKVRRIEEIEEKKEIEKYKELDFSDSFNRVWEAYPKKLAKAKAWQVFRPIDPSDELVDKMLEAIRIFSTTTQWREDEGKYIPYLKRWLEEELWYDEPKEEAIYVPSGGW